MNKLEKNIRDDLVLARVSDVDAIITTYKTIFMVEEVNQDVVDAITDDYIAGGEKNEH